MKIFIATLMVFGSLWSGCKTTKNTSVSSVKSDDKDDDFSIWNDTKAGAMGFVDKHNTQMITIGGAVKNEVLGKPMLITCDTAFTNTDGPNSAFVTNFRGKDIALVGLNDRHLKFNNLMMMYVRDDAILTDLGKFRTNKSSTTPKVVRSGGLEDVKIGDPVFFWAASQLDDAIEGVVTSINSDDTAVVEPTKHRLEFAKKSDCSAFAFNKEGIVVAIINKIGPVDQTGTAKFVNVLGWRSISTWNRATLLGTD